ncbi:Uncharacterised protein [Mycobacteroides abscessus subsp. abscessus]|nr:Uncharacterised protein [Mycobacteroides abscessus subsp. abscessus]
MVGASTSKIFTVLFETRRNAVVSNPAPNSTSWSTPSLTAASTTSSV